MVLTFRKLVSLTLLFFSICVAQEQTALLTGTLADASNKRISRATVEMNAPSGVTKTIHVDKEGVFEFRDLTPGTYQLEIHASGFLHQQIRDIQIGAGEQRRLGIITMHIGPTPHCQNLKPGEVCL